MYDILSLTNSTLLSADMILLCTKNHVPNSWFSFHFPLKNVYSPAGSVPPLSHLTSCTPTKSNLWHFFRHCPQRTCPIHTSNIPSTKSPIQFLSLRSFIQGIRPGPMLLWSFVTSLFLRYRVVSTTPNPKNEGPPLVGCPRLLIQYILSYSPFIWRPSLPSATWGRAMPWWQGTHLTWSLYHITHKLFSAQPDFQLSTQLVTISSQSFRLPSQETPSILFLCSQANILAGWRLKTQLT
jgi:hypothetical protein